MHGVHVYAESLLIGRAVGALGTLVGLVLRGQVGLHVLSVVGPLLRGEVAARAVDRLAQ